MAKKMAKRLLAGMLTAAVALPSNMMPAMAAEKADADYLLYPEPHKIEYQTGSYVVGTEMNVIYDREVDAATKARLEEVAQLKNIKLTESNAEKNGMTNVYVAVKGGDDTAEKHIQAPAASLFEKTDAYYLKSGEKKISVLGRDQDSAFYGLTTLYHVFAQMDSLSIRNFTVEDYADVVSRGFIEGYYGNPWSTEDRINLMKWGGYYKLNSYFYAPKDDPKHNKNWRELYTPDEIEKKIKPLAKAGNDSKCRFVFALHPYMHNAIATDTTSQKYRDDLKIMQDKFKQVIDAGVRQIAILADDAGNKGGQHYTKMLQDMTKWVKEQQKTYPDLKLNIPFCVQEYMGNGVNYYRNFPENVQIVMTGGRVWGEVSKNFTDAFKNNTGRAPYMWINWPCSDNSKQHLIMGGNDTFLHPGMKGEDIQGIVLNPMQQSEPSKVAIFANAAYSWNIWEQKAQADKAWEDAFSFVDHNSAVPNAASDALREMSKHMINQNMDSRVTALQESVVLKEKLNAFKEKLAAGTVKDTDVDALIKEFEVLQKAAKTYRASGNEAIKGQIVHWLNCWDDTTTAAIAYLNGVKSSIAGDISAVVDYNAQGKSAFDKSKTYGFHYVDHTEYAEVGVQHIVPFINTVAAFVSEQAELAINPDKLISKFITSRKDTPEGKLDNVFDGDEGTKVTFKNPASLSANDYIGVEYNQLVPVEDIHFVLGGGKDHFDHAKLQYLPETGDWTDLTLTGMDNVFTGVRNQVQDIRVEKKNLPANFKAKGIRLIATQANAADCWVEVREIQINKPKQAVTERYTGTVTLVDLVKKNENADDKLFDGKTDTEIWYAKPGADKVSANAAIEITLPVAKQLGSVRYTQGHSAANDVLQKAEVQYQIDGQNTWVKAGDLTNAKDQTVKITATEKIKKVRIVNKQDVNVWLRVGEIDIRAPKNGLEDVQYKVMKTPGWKASGAQGSGQDNVLYDGNDDTFVWYDPDGETTARPENKDDALVDDFLGYDFGKELSLESAHIVVGHSGGDKLVNYTIETSTNNQDWKAVPGYENYTGVTTGKDVLNIPLNGVNARYIRIRNLQLKEAWVKFSEFTVEQRNPNAGDTKNVYTNVADCSLRTNASEGKVTLLPGSISLAKDEYIGVDLKNVKEIKAIAVEAGNHAAVKLQSSVNGIEWTDVAGSSYKDARYVRLVNTGNDKVQVTVNKFEVSYNFIGQKKVESNFAKNDSPKDMRTNESMVKNVFDGNLATFGKITGPQVAGKHITFDLGRTVDFKSLRYYMKETSLDFLRHAKVEVADSKDAAQWKELMVIGNADAANESKLPASKTAKDAPYLTHDSTNPGNMYQEATGLNASGRYLRITPITTYNNRWVEIYELQINGGAYMSTESNKDVVSTITEEKGKAPSNMLDGDYATTYKPSKADGTFTYHVSTPEQRTVRIVQNGEMSNAVVKAVLYKNGQRQPAVELGRLNQIINEFAVPADSQLVEIQVAWAKVVPEISIMKTSAKAQATVNKDKLNEALAKVEHANWTADSKKAFADAKVIAQAAKDNAFVTQTVVDNAEKALLTAFNNAVMKGNTANLEQKVAAKKAQVEAGVEIYSGSSYAPYDLAVTEAQKALENKDNLSAAQVAALEKAITDAEAALQYSLIQRELAEVALERAATYAEADYTKDSYKAYTDAKAALQTIVDADKTARKNPKEINAKQTVFAEKEAGLVSVKALKAKLAEIAAKDEKIYTKNSWDALQAVVATANGYLNNGTKAQVVAVITALDDAVANLELKVSVVRPVIDEMKALKAEHYTVDSFAVLQEAIAKAEADLAAGKENLEEANVKAMRDAQKALVNVVELKAALKDAEQYKKDTYTVDSYKAFEDAVKAAAPLLNNGTKEAVATATEQIRTAITKLEVLATGMDAYRDAIVLKSADDYTADSYKAYKDAYDALMALDAKNTSEKAFQDAKSAFEAAAGKLAVELADYAKVEAAKKKVPVDLSIYTDASVKALKEAMADVDYNLPKSKQSVVDGYADAIVAAIANLVKKPVEESKPSKPGATTPGATTPGATTPDSQKPGATKPNNTKPAAPTTGDVPVLPVAGSVLVALVAILAVLKKKMSLNLF